MKELEKILNNIKEYQNNPFIHPLTCLKDSNHEILEPFIESGKIILKCPTCGYVQTYIPEFFTNFVKKEDINETKN